MPQLTKVLWHLGRDVWLVDGSPARNDLSMSMDITMTWIAIGDKIVQSIWATIATKNDMMCPKATKAESFMTLLADKSIALLTCFSKIFPFTGLVETLILRSNSSFPIPITRTAYGVSDFLATFWAEIITLTSSGLGITTNMNAISDKMITNVIDTDKFSNVIDTFLLDCIKTIQLITSKLKLLVMVVANQMVPGLPHIDALALKCTAYSAWMNFQIFSYLSYRSTILIPRSD